MNPSPFSSIASLPVPGLADLAVPGLGTAADIAGQALQGQGESSSAESAADQTFRNIFESINNANTVNFAGKPVEKENLALIIGGALFLFVVGFAALKGRG
jgi:hypothetical protein